MKNFFAHPTAEISLDTRIGSGTKIWHQAQIRENVVIGKNCHIGKGVYIDRDVIIGNNVKIQNGVSIYKGVRLENEVFVGPNASFTNDIRPRSFANNWKVIPTLLKKGASVGANATVLCGVTLGAYSMLSAGAVLTIDALPFGLYIGNPARLKGFVSRSGFELELLSRKGNSLLFHSKESKEQLRISFKASRE